MALDVLKSMTFLTIGKCFLHLSFTKVKLLFKEDLQSQHMTNISVAEILKIHGGWMQSSKLADLVAEKLNITVRQAYTLIKKAWGRNEILKEQLPNRAILYGLAEFGPMPIESSNGEKPQVKTLSYQDAFLYRCLERLDKIRLENIKNSEVAFWDLRSLVKMLPPLYETLRGDFEKTEKSLRELSRLLREGKGERVQTSVATIDGKIYGGWDVGHLTLYASVEVEDLISKASALFSKRFESNK